MKRFDWKKSIIKYCLNPASSNRVLGPVDENVLSLALLRIRAGENGGPVTVICRDGVMAEKLKLELTEWINVLN